jgi:hypothetical protein
MIPEATRSSACRCLCKSGELSAHTKELRVIAASLSKAEVVEFYCFLRDHSQRWESEWRKEFLSIFAISEEELPGVDDSDRWSSILHSLVAQGQVKPVRAFIEGIGLLAWRFQPEPDQPEIAVYPLDDQDAAGETPAAKARRLGHIEVATFLESTREAIASPYRTAWNAVYAKNC